MTAPLLPYGRQSIGEDDVAAVAAVLRSDFLTTGPTAARFEEEVAKRVGAKFAAICSSGTAALHLAALALGLGKGDRVVVPTLTFLATANAARYVDAEVVFADVDPETGLMTDETLTEALERAGGAAAVFPVHLNGQCADMAAIEEIARRERLKIVEDASHALGTTDESSGAPVPVGSCKHSELTIFSFHPVKTIAMGEGGAVTTNDARLHERLARFRNHGILRDEARMANGELAFDAEGALNPWYYEMPEPGFNYRASDIHCALGLSQLGKLGAFVARRRQLAAHYDAALEPLAPIVRPVARVSDCTPAWHLYAARIDFAGAGVTRAQVMARLKAEGIGSQVHYLPVHLQPYYARRYGASELPGARAYYERALSLPLFPAMADADVARVVGALKRALGV
ncbi:MAG TPA: UDP-4-amino-4,6-dideoxy-N-acetyl-beta-L-altrosamine transaminase [Alphaproteobacteria bacterium]|nr:UDP-4-amino-4,6-dideoxy-N-acetyl-beta-L-altrosamine transaminase [Alphaproteobacteria bacterium]